MPTIRLYVGDGVKKIDYKWKKTSGVNTTRYGSVYRGETRDFAVDYYGYVEFTYAANSDYIEDGYSTQLWAKETLRWSGSVFNLPFESGTTEDLNVTYEVYAKINRYTITYDYDDGTGRTTTAYKNPNVTYYLFSTRPKRNGYVFRYWLGGGKQWRPGAAYTDNKSITFTAVWSEKTYFYWHGSDANDANYFQVDNRVDLAVTASSWLALCRYVNLLRVYCYLDTASFSPLVSEGDEISASGFNKVAKAIQDCVDEVGGTSPPTVEEGALIKVSNYNGTGSIKAAANSVMDAL